MNEDYAKREHARRDSTSITSRDLNSDRKSWHGKLPDVDSTKSIETIPRNAMKCQYINGSTCTCIYPHFTIRLSQM